MRELLLSVLRYFLLIAAILVGFKLYKWHSRIQLEADDRTMEPEYPPGGHRIDVSVRRASDLPVGAAVAYHPPDSPNLTRAGWVIAVEGQRVAIRERRLWVDGKGAERKVNVGRRRLPEIRVPGECLFVVTNTTEEGSLRYGPIPMSHVLGRLK